MDRALLLALLLLVPALAGAGSVEAAYAAYSKGREAVAAGDPAAARVAFEEAAKGSPTWLLPRLELAELAVARREGIEASRAALLGFLSTAPDNPRLYRLLGLCAELSGDDPEAVDLLGRSLGLAPAQPELRGRRAAILERLGRSGEAADEQAWLLREAPSDLALRARHADALEAAGRHEEALRELTELVRLEPDRESPLRRVARFHERRGDLAAAAKAHGRADALAKQPRKGRNLRPLQPSRW